jgi:polysaccharide export outer membrane protein
MVYQCETISFSPYFPPLTPEKCLYNCKRVGEIYLMNIIRQRVFHLLARVTCWPGMLLLLAAPAALSQQTSQAPVAPKFQNSAETNDRIAQLAAANTAKTGDYVIGSGDLLVIEVFEVPELSKEVRITETGYFSLPLLPTKVRAAGLTTAQLQEKLEELLQTNGLISMPQVTVTLKEQHSQPITVIGAVKNAMVIQAIRQTTLLEVLSQAGGVMDDAGNVVLVTRTPAPPLVPERAEEKTADFSADPPPPPQIFTINLSDLLETGDARFNIPILGGDVVSVPHAGIFYVVGAVNKPGGFVMQNDRDKMTTLKAVSLAGGTILTAKTKDAVILRKNPGVEKRQELPVNLDSVMKLKTEDAGLQPGDILFIPDSSGKRALRRAGDIGIALTTGIAVISAGKL